MSTVEEIVVDAFGLLTLIDMAEASTSPSETKKGVRALNQMIDGWASQGLVITDQTRTCVVALSSATLTAPTDPITGLIDVSRLSVGMNVNGVGIPVGARIRSIDDANRTILLDQLATAPGTVSLTFQALPFQAKYEEGIAAMLALRIALLAGEDNIPAMVQLLAKDGWNALQANFLPRVPAASFDPMLTHTATQRMNAQTNG